MVCSAGQRMLPETLFSRRIPCLATLALLAQLSSAQALDLQLAWDASRDSDVVTYALYYSEANSPFATRLDVGNTTSWTISGLASEKSYSIYATAVDAAGRESDSSNVIQYSPPPLISFQDAASPSDGSLIGLAPAESVSFYRGINVGGPGLVIDGNNWDGESALNYVSSGKLFSEPGVQFAPAPDPAHAQMLSTGVYGPDLRLAITSVPSGNYDVYIWTFEDSGSLTASLSILGNVVTTFSTGQSGSWQRVGPFRVAATEGGIDLRIAAANDWPVLSGVEFWSVQ
jgi:hypothetical protein